MIQTIIDKRECKLIEILKDEDNIKSQVLDIGDIIIYRDDIPMIIIERKTLSDLAASIMDGRYREQKKRLRITNILKKYFIIEGNIEDYQGSMPYSTLESAMISILLNDDIPIIRSNSILNTAKIIKLFMSKLVKFKYKNIDNSDADFNIVKKAKLTPSDCFMAQLCQIPSISKTIAGCIVNKYDTFNKFYMDINNLDNKIEFIKNLEYNTDKNRVMRIGPSKATKIVEFLF